MKELFTNIVLLGLLGYAIKLALLGFAFFAGAFIWIIGVVVWASNKLGEFFFPEKGR